MGELLTRWFLNDHGLRVIAANVRLDGGEIDILALDHGKRVVFEVRTITGSGEPIDAVDPTKRQRVRRLAMKAGASRADFVGVRIDPAAVVFHWVPGGA
ncbi:MAG TPA: YraN family protein [Acidimicrobiia bacterium]|nr:YraN family protein [Acidimicrobiia bacterium]